MKRGYWFHILVAMDQLLNSILRGYPDESLSARCYRERRFARYVIDSVFFWQKDAAGRRHCEQCYWYERERMDMPVEYRRTKSWSG